MNKRYQRPVTRMYVTLIALLIIVSLAGFIDKGKSVTIHADGTVKTVYTHAINEEALMRENKIVIGPYDELQVSTPKLTEGSQVTVCRAVPVTIEYKGQKQQVLSEENIVIRIGALSKKTITEDEVVPYAVESIPDENIGRGEEQILQEGKDGRKKVTVNIVSLDGKVIGREPVSTTLVTEMQPLIRHVGTKETVEINTGAISKYKKVFTMVATAYLPTDGNGEGITKMGTIARYGVVAVDPNIIPLGSRVFIPGYGLATAEDTGGDILGNRIDLCMEDYNSCMRFGRRTVPVYVLE